MPGARAERKRTGCAEGFVVGGRRQDERDLGYYKLRIGASPQGGRRFLHQKGKKPTGKGE